MCQRPRFHPTSVEILEIYFPITKSQMWTKHIENLYFRLAWKNCIFTLRKTFFFLPVCFRCCHRGEVRQVSVGDSTAHPGVFFYRNHSNFMSLSKTRLRGSDEGRAPFIYAASQGEEDESHLALLGRIFRFTASHCSGHLTWRAGIDRKNLQLCLCTRCATPNESQQD